MEWYSPVDNGEVKDYFNFDKNILDNHASKTHSPLLTFDQYRQRRMSKSLTHISSDPLNNDYNFVLSPFYKSNRAYEDNGNITSYKPYSSFNYDYKPTPQEYYKHTQNSYNPTTRMYLNDKTDWINDRDGYYKEQDGRSLDRRAGGLAGRGDNDYRRSGGFEYQRGNVSEYNKHYPQVRALSDCELSPYEPKIAKVPVYNNVTVNTSYQKPKSHDLSELEISPLYKPALHRVDYRKPFNYSTSGTGYTDKGQTYTFYNPDPAKRSYYGTDNYRGSNLTPSRSVRSERSEVLGPVLKSDDNKWKRQRISNEYFDRTPDRADKTDYLINHEETRYVSPPYDYNNIGLFDTTPVKRSKPYTTTKPWSTNPIPKNYSTINF